MLSPECTYQFTPDLPICRLLGAYGRSPAAMVASTRLLPSPR